MYQVLLVDDQDIIKRLVKRFSIWGHDTGFIISAEASDGEEALQALREYPIDIIITDIRMPKVDGLELLQKVMSLQLCKYVILISEHAEFEYAQKGIQYGAYGYLVKPLCESDLGELLARIGRQIEMSRRQIPEKPNVAERDPFFVREQEVQTVIRYLTQEKIREAVHVIQKIAENIALLHGDNWNIRMKELEGIYQELSRYFGSRYRWLDLITDIDRFNYQMEHVVWISEADEQNYRQLEEILKNYIEEMGEIINRFQYTAGNNPVIQETVSYILDHVESEITVAEVAKQVHVNGTYLSNLFRKKTGFTIKEFMVRVKMERAKKLLVAGHLKTYEIAQKIGYVDYEYFSKVFKKNSGFTPTQFRQNLKKVGE